MPLSPLPRLDKASARSRLGESPRSLQRGVSGGELVRLRRGVYVGSAEWAGLNARNRYLLQIEATQATASNRLVFSHESAAAIWGIPLVGSRSVLPSITAPSSGGRRSRHGVIRHSVDLREEDIVERSGFVVTSPLRTAIDLIASRPMMSGVVSLDHMLRENRVFGLEKDELWDYVDEFRPFRNVRRAVTVIDFATGMSGSPLESVSMVRFHDFGYVLPAQQVRYLGAHGEEYLADFTWRDIAKRGLAVIGEADGRIKLEDLEYLRGRTPEQALWEEKVRQDELREQSSAFVRWGWDDAWQGGPLIRKLDRAGVPRDRRVQAWRAAR